MMTELCKDCRETKMNNSLYRYGRGCSVGLDGAGLPLPLFRSTGVYIFFLAKREINKDENYVVKFKQLKKKYLKKSFF